MKIGISKSDSKFDRYLKWLDFWKVDYAVLDYESKDDLAKLDECSGLILTGGVDIYPELYCDWDTVETRGTYLPMRDGFEFKLLEKAINVKMPVLGICRGCQLVNVFFRGSLIFDLEQIRGVNHRKISQTEDRIHKVVINKNSLLFEIMGISETDVTSSHHQSVDRLGEGLMINAKASDGVVEGVEYLNKEDKGFLVAVQWHPERFLDFEDIASKNLLLKFLNEVKLFYNMKIINEV
ncbi:MAG TPA: gamma-glutamyl-gamma-aminobutyrate hydrolase family protein [Ignavibacteria bacterium]|nr:gamma-glutamyl-gamma-aminobutyrate hydrolase family protein [Ignavibacteria bacterium]